MLSQHLITQPVFEALFEGYAFSENNPVSQVMNAMVEVLDGENLENETTKLESFYESVRVRAAGIDDAAAAKQTIVKELYEKFFSTAFSKTSEKLGIVYTPNEIVDFNIHSVKRHPERRSTRRYPMKACMSSTRSREPARSSFVCSSRAHQAARPRAEVQVRASCERDRAARVLRRRDQHRGDLPLAPGGEYVPFDGIV